jgi:septal ring-binding cell division protein DamX
LRQKVRGLLGDQVAQLLVECGKMAEVDLKEVVLVRGVETLSELLTVTSTSRFTTSPETHEKAGGRSTVNCEHRKGKQHDERQGAGPHAKTRQGKKRGREPYRYGNSFPNRNFSRNAAKRPRRSTLEFGSWSVWIMLVT